MPCARVQYVMLFWMTRSSGNFEFATAPTPMAAPPMHSITSPSMQMPSAMMVRNSPPPTAAPEPM